MQGYITDQLFVSGMSKVDAEAKGKTCTPVLRGLKEQLKDQLKLCKSGSPKSPGTRADNLYKDREMRIAVAAESNSAVDNILASLDADPNFRAKGYKVIRLGPTTKVGSDSCRVDLHTG